MNFNELKSTAKDHLRNNYTSKMLLFIIPIFLSISQGAQLISNYDDVSNIPFRSLADPNLLVMSVIFAIVLFGIALSILLSLFVQIITDGAVFNYLKIYREERENPQFSNIFIPFKDGSWLKLAGLHLLKGVILFLLTVSIIGIPFAIYFSLGWSQSVYVLYDQLETGHYQGIKNVLHESSQLMSGQRFRLFAFYLSYIGWFLLVVITGGLINFWLTPYLNMSLIAFYDDIKSNQV